MATAAATGPTGSGTPAEAGPPTSSPAALPPILISPRAVRHVGLGTALPARPDSPGLVPEPDDEPDSPPDPRQQGGGPLCAIGSRESRCLWRRQPAPAPAPSSASGGPTGPAPIAARGHLPTPPPPPGTPEGSLEELLRGGLDDEDLPPSPGPLAALQHRLLAYFARQSAASPTQGGLYASMYPFLANMLLVRFQFLGPDRLLVKFAMPTDHLPTLPQTRCLLAVYDLAEHIFVAVHSDLSPELLRLTERSPDELYGVDSPVAVGPSALPRCWRPLALASPADDYQARSHQERLVRAMADSARCRENPALLTRLQLAWLPAPAQLAMHSPYLDRALFGYDPHLAGPLEAPKPFATRVRFSHLPEGTLAFELFIQPPDRGEPDEKAPSRRTVAYHFNPVFPIVISVVHLGPRSYATNLHLWAPG
ncbi:putative De-etiolated protein 1 Det1 [Paratrimastix pyriformis]|uniref:De-etiolated protein 1 Det1 n=1 Tax=Paratrimastix pyriformis TaxID=342808 RepID=A0ABQ8UQ98_9EUKA|nr:putative De-etiolated protein 1 Det1 [Paratrimastix pyriformis]